MLARAFDVLAAATLFSTLGPLPIPNSLCTTINLVFT